jgi:hypothetical protein
MNRLASAASAALIVLLALSASALAQDVVIQGPGIKLGESTVVHPRTGAEAGFLSNVFYEEDDPIVAPIVRFLAGFDLQPSGIDRLGAEERHRTIDFKLGAEVVYQEYVSGSDAVRSQRSLDADATGSITFNPDGAVALDLGDRFVRTARPTNFESSSQLTRDRNHFRAESRYQPGGRLLTFGLRYENVIDVFESDDSDFANRMHQTVGLNGKWKFFPYSQLWLDASLGFFGTIGEASEAANYKIGSNPLRILAGIDTVLTEATTIKAYAGYADGFYESGPSFRSMVGGADFGWRYMPVGRLSVGYKYDVNDSINANYYGEHHIRAGIGQTLRRFLITLGTGVRFRGYRGVPMSVGGTNANRDDFIYEAGARIDFFAADRLSIYLDGGAQSVSTEFRDLQGDDPSFLRAEIVAGVVAAF